MQVRLVAYRPATSTATIDTTYELDLQEAPNISLNFQFADIKEPEKRKGGYSQTFKLPFTDNNNEFFQNWFNVNLTDLVFSTRKKFNAVLYYGTVPQFQGYIQLRSVYQKAKLYEVSLVANTSDLFVNIGTKKLSDVFLNDDGSYSDEFNHIFDETQMKASWDGSATSTFQNTAGASLRDATAGVQKIMYPLSFTIPGSYYNETNNKLNYGSTESLSDSADKRVPITQFRPAIQLKALFQLILARAGFSYTSSFIDGSYFGKLYMTTCNHITIPAPVCVAGVGALPGIMRAGSDGIWGVGVPGGAPYYLNAGESLCGAPMSSLGYTFEADVDSATTGGLVDDTGVWNTSTNVFFKADDNMIAATLNFNIRYQNIQTCALSGGVGDYSEDNILNFEVQAYYYDNATSSYTLNPVPGATYTFSSFPLATLYSGAGVAANQQATIQFVDLSNMQTGTYCYFIIRCTTPFKLIDTSNFGYILMGNAPTAFTEGNYYSLIEISWLGYSDNPYGKEIDIPSCIDPNITQRGFIKDILQRFNLVLVTNPEDDNDLIIQTYNDYLGSGALKDWTKKLDLSKEIIVKDTLSLQKLKTIFTDLEDVDIQNKSIANELPNWNVWGKYEETITNNEFAKGELKNTSIFSPYINSKIFRSADDVDSESIIANMAVQYEWTYKAIGDGSQGYENSLEETKPKLFYYIGTALPTLQDDNVTGVTYYMHSVDASNALTFHTFTTFPLCSVYDLDATGASPVVGVSTITNTTKSLHWDNNPPTTPELHVFNADGGGYSPPQALYQTYWSQYLNAIYNTDARIMEAYFNLNSVDIFQFRFSDEIFIKDSYYRILDIKNYQVGANASTKLTLLKMNDVYADTAEDAGYVTGTTPDGGTVYAGLFDVFCPSTDPSCTFSFPDSVCVPTDVCEAGGGTPVTYAGYCQNAGLDEGFYLCFTSTGSMPIKAQNIFGVRSPQSIGTKNLISNKIAGKSIPLLTGENTGKFSQSLLKNVNNDIIIKYNTLDTNNPLLSGESHKLILMGNTSGTTRGYAYVKGDSSLSKLEVPFNTNMIIRVKGVATVIGGTSSTYVQGYTEGFAYYTAFKNVGGTISQLSTPGGQQEFSIREGANPTTCTLYITTSTSELQFGLDDSQTDTKRVWQLTVDLDVNRLPSMQNAVDLNYALFQNGNIIVFENLEILIWN